MFSGLLFLTFQLMRDPPEIIQDAVNVSHLTQHASPDRCRFFNQRAAYPQALSTELSCRDLILQLVRNPTCKTGNELDLIRVTSPDSIITFNCSYLHPNRYPR